MHVIQWGGGGGVKLKIKYLRHVKFLSIKTDFISNGIKFHVISHPTALTNEKISQMYLL